MSIQHGLPGVLVEKIESLGRGSLICRPANSRELGVVLGVENGHVKIYWFNAESGNERWTNEVFRPRSYWLLAASTEGGVAPPFAPGKIETEVPGSLSPKPPDDRGPGPGPVLPAVIPPPEAAPKTEDLPQPQKGSVDPKSQDR